MLIKNQKVNYPLEEYLAKEEQAQIRSEYHDGEIIAMAGETTNHNQIIGNIYFSLRVNFKAKNYQIYTENVRLWIARYQAYTYPDLMVIEGDPIYHGQGTTTVLNPCVIFEVSSKSTKNYDQGDKFDYYRSLSDLQEYIIISQSRYHVMHYSKNAANQWLLTEYEAPESTLTIASISCSLVMMDIYEKVDFDRKED